MIFGATGDLAKIETFPALVGLVKRGILGAPSGPDFRTFPFTSLYLTDRE